MVNRNRRRTSRAVLAFRRCVSLPSRVRLATLGVFIAALGCGSSADLPVTAGTGPSPVLPRPEKSLIPTVNVVDAKGWPANAKPTAVEGTEVHAFATELRHPRWLYVLPNGDVLVAETNAPPRPDDAQGIKAVTVIPSVGP